MKSEMFCGTKIKGNCIVCQRLKPKEEMGKATMHGTGIRIEREPPKEDIKYRKYILGKYGCFTIELKPNTPVREYKEEKKHQKKGGIKTEKNKKITKIQCLDCKTMFDAKKGEELLISCPTCDSQNLRFIIGTFQDPTTIREVIIKRVLK